MSEQSEARQTANSAVSINDVTAWWATAVSDIEPGVIRLRGFAIEDMIEQSSFVESIWTMVRGERPSRDQAQLLEKALVAAVDHGPQAPSIAAARMASTCGVGLHGAMSTGVGLLGDVHGGAGQQCSVLLDQLVREIDRRTSNDIHTSRNEVRRSVVEDAIADLRKRKIHVPGFGHRFHPRDPRRDPLLGAVEAAVTKGTVTGRYLEVAAEIESQLALRGRQIPMNIDGATAVIYSELGFPAELSRGLFILSRSVGVLAHSWEESQSGKRIKGPLPPPLLADYNGYPSRSIQPDSETA